MMLANPRIPKEAILESALELLIVKDIFNDPILTAAMVDRLTCRAHVINIKGDSYRMRETKEWLTK